MSHYANARFRSSSVAPSYRIPRSASELLIASSPTVEFAVRYKTASTRVRRDKLERRSMIAAERKLLPMVFDKVANIVDIKRLAKTKTEIGNPASNDRVVVISRQSLLKSGSILSTARSKPLVERVGSIYRHPTTQVNEELLKQKALRSAISLPILLERLRSIGGEPLLQAVAESPLPKAPAVRPHQPVAAEGRSGDSPPALSKPLPKARLKSDVVTPIPATIPQPLVPTTPGLVDDADAVDARIARAKGLIEQLDAVKSSMDPDSRNRAPDGVSEKLERIGIDRKHRTSENSLCTLIDVRVKALKEFLRDQESGAYSSSSD